MRVFAQCAAVGILAAFAAVSGTVTAQTKDPSALLAEARQALGGEKKLTAVKSFTATGRTRQVRGDNLVPIEFEIFVELPDKYLRKDEIPAQESGPTSTGFNGEELIQLPVPATPPAGGPRAQRRLAERLLKPLAAGRRRRLLARAPPPSSRTSPGSRLACSPPRSRHIH